ncbi:MAG TPA: hypothetical protein VJM53_02500 [Burkholderiales bacterium]|nr:hypothetical protein [Burkholderiales bacterium]
MKTKFILGLLLLAFVLPGYTAEEAIEATTAKGEKVRLLPNGRWEYVNEAKQVEAKKVFESYPENRNPNAQGGVFGIGRSINPGDKDYNRGSLNPKTR